MTEEMVSGAWAHPPDDICDPIISLYNLIMMAPSGAIVGEDAINNNGEEKGDTVKRGAREMKGWLAPRG
ncbi:hypothetical protein D8674_024153 [Pyrus ussuriensis x Pyrus communis]|uniref:Uncharacterized protein n=1 Tax=Pyrus ussuriensis x Pyrus communis TaxID=2448454 RepID=A0A5N5H6Z3_9ROSA|nr:hypothetical protein D8674_024153 [Pyrus ussuriensis x Pyrus communis]